MIIVRGVFNCREKMELACNPTCGVILILRAILPARIINCYVYWQRYQAVLVFNFKAIKEFFTGKTYDLPELDFEVICHDGKGSIGVELFNDDVTPMEYVVVILEKYFGQSLKEAVNTMLEIHTNGSVIISVADAKTAGLLVNHIASVSRERNFPFECVVK